MSWARGAESIDRLEGRRGGVVTYTPFYVLSGRDEWLWFRHGVLCFGGLFCFVQKGGVVI